MDLYKEIEALENEIELHSEEQHKRYDRLKELKHKQLELEMNTLDEWFKESIANSLKSVSDFVKSGHHNVIEYTLKKVESKIYYDELQNEPLDYQIRVTHFECYSAVEVMFKYDRQIVKDFIIKWFEENRKDFDYNEKGSSYFKGF